MTEKRAAEERGLLLCSLSFISCSFGLQSALSSPGTRRLRETVGGVLGVEHSPLPDLVPLFPLLPPDMDF